jgi:flavin reductase (DIM6/NTAB) family NADH-FMN oxidoreductase RutF
MTQRQQFIDAMRGVANSVTVVTTDGPAGRHGATVSAFCSVSADPPTVLVCLNAQSTIADLVMQNRRYTVTVLPEHCQHLADRFAGRFDATLTNRFAGIENTSQLVAGATIFECELDSSVLSGSHQVVIGKVISCQSGEERPLTYLDGAYHCVSRFVEAAE